GPPRRSPWPGPPRCRRRTGGPRPARARARTVVRAPDPAPPPRTPARPAEEVPGRTGRGSRPSRSSPCSDRHLDAVLLELRDHVLAQQLDRVHDRLVREVAELHVAQQPVDAERGVSPHLLETSIRV